MTRNMHFNVEAIEHVTLAGPAALMARDWMSPFAWTEPDGRVGIMVRAVCKPGTPMTDTGVVWAGWGDGKHFEMLPAPAILPGPDAHDIGGVEDPTVLRMEDGSYVVYYTGVAADMAHGELSYASGASVEALTKSGVVLASTKSMGNTKEATVGQTRDGHWRLYYEYAGEVAPGEFASRVGLAIGEGVAGPWTEQPAPFTVREKSWDNFHLSTGPMLMDDPDHPVMFYNGATRDARWRIGWAMFDHNCTKLVARGIEPLVVPPPAEDRNATDIAFAASVITQGRGVWLYYSLEDRMLARARIVRS
jgi:predicted GH43/DUF377 family glycosyl hydrolase